MKIDLRHKRSVSVVLALALASCRASTVLTGSASARSADCGVHLLPSLDPSGAEPHGELLDLTPDGIYVGTSSDATGADQATYWRDGVATSCAGRSRGRRPARRERPPRRGR